MVAAEHGLGHAICGVLLAICYKYPNRHFESYSEIHLPPSRVCAAVNVEYFSCDELSLHQEQSSIYDFLNCGQPPNWVQALQRLMVFGLVHRRVYDTRRNGVHADSLSCVLNRQPSGSRVQPTLCDTGERCIDSGYGLLSQRRGNRDDLTATVLLHVSCGFLRHVEKTCQIRRDDAMKVLGRVLDKLFWYEDSSVVNQHIDVPESMLSTGDDVPRGGRLTYVAIDQQ